MIVEQKTFNLSADGDFSVNDPGLIKPAMPETDWLSLAQKVAGTGLGIYDAYREIESKYSNNNEVYAAGFPEVVTLSRPSVSNSSVKQSLTKDNTVLVRGTSETVSPPPGSPFPYWLLILLVIGGIVLITKK